MSATNVKENTPLLTSSHSPWPALTTTPPSGGGNGTMVACDTSRHPSWVKVRSALNGGNPGALMAALQEPPITFTLAAFALTAFSLKLCCAALIVIGLATIAAIIRAKHILLVAITLPPCQISVRGLFQLHRRG